MIVELKPSATPGDWYLCVRGTQERHLVDIDPAIEELIYGRRAFFEVERVDETWTISRFVARLAVDNSAVRQAAPTARSITGAL